MPEIEFLLYDNETQSFLTVDNVLSYAIDFRALSFLEIKILNF